MHCRICHSSGPFPDYLVEEMMFGMHEKFEYFECTNCGCLQIKQIPLNIEKYYPEEYASFFALSDDITSNKTSFKNTIRKWRDRAAVLGNNFIGRLILPFFPEPALMSLSPLNLSLNAKILDIGCGKGTLLCLLRNIGFKQVLGIDRFIDEDILYKNGVVIKKQALEDVSGHWDVIMFHHSFEHFPLQLEPLERAKELLSDKGVCLVRIPTISCFVWKEYGVDWVSLDAPRHFYLHTLKSMKILAEQVGLYISHHYWDATDFQFWGSEQYKQGISLYDENSHFLNPENSVFSPKDIQGFKEKTRELNQQGLGDNLVVYLKKKVANKDHD